MPFDLAEVMASDVGNHDDEEEEKVRTYYQRKNSASSLEKEEKKEEKKRQLDKAAAAGGTWVEEEATCNWRRGFPKSPLPDVPFDLGIRTHTVSQPIKSLVTLSYPNTP